MSQDPDARPTLPIPPLPPPGAVPPPPMRAMPPYPPSVIGYGGGGRACPGCGSGPLHEPGFTWWGGLVGHKILGVEQCKSCKRWWVKNTAQPGTTRVTVYVVVGIVLGLALAAAWIFANIS